ncbi:SCO family protein [Tautonia sociabilis]|uniref:Redoxin domain-containing protein n=1 Tax=Tautonia sociabilis TaxID=2080755 RepID=A0A432MKY7_9BACT|nr:SCO family protein [Tautonia sociabilis]RUL87748.1 redoxin domain-containing protein [Tautonia sociabilis]
MPSPNGSIRTLTRLALAALPLATGCDATAPRPPEAASPTPETPEPGEVATFSFEGVVRHVDPDSGVVSIDHEDIPGLMPAMLMDFHPEDRALLEDTVVDDEVVGTLRVEYGDRGEVTALDLVDLVVSRPAPPRPPGAEPGSVSPPGLPPRLEPGQLVPDFEVTTQQGEPLRLSDLRGKVVVLTFVFTRCPDPNFCPLMDAKFAQLADRVARSPERTERVRLLSVSFDPEHDTPEVLASHARRVGADPPLWTYAVASHEELAKVSWPLGLSYGPDGAAIRHTLSTAVIAPDGTLARLEEGNSWTPADLDGEIRRLLDR